MQTKRTAPSIKNRTVPFRRPNWELRSREYLTPNEIGRLIEAARKNRWGHRDATMILLAFRHGLRASELCELKWDQFDLRQASVHVNRLKNGISSVHPLGGTELRALRKIKREEPESRFLFLSERGAPMTAEGCRKMVRRAGEAAKFPFTIHPHMIRHACGYKLANEGRDTRAIQLYMGHRNIQNTVGYTQLSAERFKDFWID
jgi:type 1 fimbriae regulatory protein FimE